MDASGVHTYRWLERAARDGAARLLDGREDLGEARIAFLVAPGADWVRTLWSVWRAGGVAVPLCASHPPPELAHVLDDARPEAVIAGPEYADRLRPLTDRRGLPLRKTGDEEGPPGPTASAKLPAPTADRRALILYTSGTTGRPKGVVTTHGNLASQVQSLVDAWEWRAEDRILHVLPLHHTHGIVNALLCPLRVGAACEMAAGFDAEAVWERLAAGSRGDAPPITVFMAVPTIYVKLLRAWEKLPEARREAAARGARGLRLAVSGSAALPVPVFRRWREVTGDALLERYGMTEIGMALSNPLHGERRPGTVGRPLPGVAVRRVDEAGRLLEAPSTPGEIEVRGPGVFLEYWRRPEETRRSFRDGWFRTGDVAVVEDGYWRLLGRRSVDILKTGGYKVSALEVEAELRGHPSVEDCAVVGVPDPEWGERVCVAVVPREPSPGDAEPSPGDAERIGKLDAWLRARLAPYKLPRRWRIVSELPRNAMGKVQKPEVQTMFEDEEVAEPPQPRER